MGWWIVGRKCKAREKELYGSCSASITTLAIPAGAEYIEYFSFLPLNEYYDMKLC
jgi:hypothetical protein